MSDMLSACREVPQTHLLSGKGPNVRRASEPLAKLRSAHLRDIERLGTHCGPRFTRTDTKGDKSTLVFISCGFVDRSSARKKRSTNSHERYSEVVLTLFH